MFRWLQHYPHFLEILYDLFENSLTPLKRWFKPGGWNESMVITLEKWSKGAVFNCKMCGQCILHSTGMTCPMNCPKNLRNGPCGGVREDGHCEVIPERMCIWVQAWERSQEGIYAHEMGELQPPVNRALQGSSAWINMAEGIDMEVPPGWVALSDVQ